MIGESWISPCKTSEISQHRIPTTWQKRWYVFRQFVLFLIRVFLQVDSNLGCVHMYIGCLHLGVLSLSLSRFSLSLADYTLIFESGGSAKTSYQHKAYPGIKTAKKGTLEISSAWVWAGYVQLKRRAI